MREQKFYYVYIMASRSRTLYIGITSEPEQPVTQHKSHALPGFSSKYRCERLVFIERYAHPQTAITRAKQLKGWLRARKIALIEETNPAWTDLSEGWGKPLACVGDASIKKCGSFASLRMTTLSNLENGAALAIQEMQVLRF